MADQELADRARRRFERHRAEAKLPPSRRLLRNAICAASSASVASATVTTGLPDFGAGTCGAATGTTER